MTEGKDEDPRRDQSRSWRKAEDEFERKGRDGKGVLRREGATELGRAIYASS